MQAFIKDFLCYKKIDHQASVLSLDAYYRDLRTLVSFAGGQPLEKLTRADLRRYVVAMRAKGLADTTIRRQWSTFSQFFTFLMDEVEDAGVKKSPTKGFKFSNSEKQESFHLEIEERKQLFTHLQTSATTPKGKLDCALFGLLYYCGLRVTEGVTRRLCDIREDEHGHFRLDVVGKRNKRRTVVIHPTAYSWLTDWLHIRPDTSDLVFIHPSTKNPVSRKLAWERLKGAMKKAGLSEDVVKKTGPHTLRHSRASDLHNAGYDLIVVRDFLGHSQIQTTGIYIHKTSPQVDSAVLGVD